MPDTMRLTVLVHKGVCHDATAMNDGKVIKMATVGGAGTLGMSGSLGTIEVGKKADIVLMNLRHLRSIPVHDPLETIVYSSSTEDIDTTIVNGKVIYHRGVFSCRIDEAQLAEQVMRELPLIRQS